MSKKKNKQVEKEYHAVPVSTEALTSDVSSKEAEVSGASVGYVAANIPTSIEFKLKNGRKVVIKSNAEHLRGLEKGILPIGTYGITTLPLADCEELFERYKNSPQIQNGLMFWGTSYADVLSEANAKHMVRHGYEPMNVRGEDPRHRTKTAPGRAGE